MNDTGARVRPRPTRLFPSYFLGGFECTTAVNGGYERIDEAVLTGHERLVRADYRRLRQAGILAARDGVRWNLVDRAGRLDFTSALPFVEAAEDEGITVIWDLFHYGYPDDLDPFEEPFVARFARYCRTFARMLVRRGHGERGPGATGQRFYTPVNEISYFAWAGGCAGVFAPHATDRAPELKRRLAEAAIRGIDAIRSVDPAARFVHCDPIVRVVPPADAPWLADEARHFNEVVVLEGCDMLAGRLAPELGGSPSHLDILGVNYYGINQWEHTRPERVLAPDDPRRAPLSDILCDLWARYGRPMLLSETSSIDEMRPQWLAMVTDECLKAAQRGAQVHGVCIYPVVGMADWHGSGEYLNMGLWDISPSWGSWRLPHWPTMAALRELRVRAEARPLVRPRRPVPARV